MAALRDAKMWSQAELAKKAGVSSKTIYNIEDGRPAYRITLGLIAKALNVEYRHLLLNETSMELLYNELIGRLNSGSTRAELLAYLQSSNFIIHTLDIQAYHEIKLHWNLRIGSFTLDLCIGELLETARRYSWHVVLIDEPTRYIFDEDGKPAAEVLAGIQQLENFGRWVAAERKVARHILEDADESCGKTLVVGRRSQFPDDQTAGILKQLYDDHHGIIVRTYDWIVGIGNRYYIVEDDEGDEP